MPLTLYFLRHGQTASSRDDTFCGSGLDPELTAEGRAMAEAFAHAYRSTPWAAVYSSPLVRTVETARALSERLNLDVERRDGLKEIAYGAWEGLTREAVDRDFHDDYLRWVADPAWNAPTGGERGIMIARRLAEVIAEIVQQVPDGPVLAVSHKAAIRIALASLLGIDVARFRQRFACPVASVTIVEFGPQGPQLRALADRSHLPQALRELPGT
ncbi:MAG TPA: histidine phosphatase family protein [Thermoanaerobaculia bacterium]|nr:histidine phosphatase family protein [Thermoanaerobaculia bacterium]